MPILISNDAARELYVFLETTEPSLISYKPDHPVESLIHEIALGDFENFKDYLKLTIPLNDDLKLPYRHVPIFVTIMVSMLDEEPAAHFLATIERILENKPLW